MTNGTMADGVAALQANAVTKRYPVRGFLGRTRGFVSALDKVSLELHAGETVALVGESGSGKSTLTRLLARLESPSEGQLLLGGQPVPRTVPGSLREYSGTVQLVLQDPYASLNPAHDVGYVLTRALTIHGKGRSRRSVRSAAAELLERVQLRPADQFLAKYPHELSGGQRQRVAIARALAAEPAVLLADEPVSMLDVSIRLGLLSLLRQIRDESNLALLYVTHDISTARYFSDRTVVLYAGRAVEQGTADEVILDPKHPYTQLLVSAAPDPRRTTARVADDPLGEPPDPATPPPGCRFHPRCPFAMPKCSRQNPPLLPVAAGRAAACWLLEDSALR
jgi:peptide/nickel transport system ATP-binding protein